MGEDSRLYEAGDQRNYSKDEVEGAERYHEGTTHSHKALDSKDNRSIANKLAAEAHDEHKPDKKALEQRQSEQDATLPARSHGNEPSRGAKIDQQLREEEEEELRRKGKA